jgi:predicted nucleic acid-binding protein
MVVRGMSGPNPDKNVAKWRSGVDESDIFFSVAVIMEQRKGIEIARRKRNADLAKMAQSEKKLSDFINAFWDHFLHVDSAIAEEWGKLIGENQQDLADLLIAATANVKKYAVVTRNVAHFKDRVKTVIDPFKPVKA